MPTILQNRYVLAVPDAATSARFFVEALGFRVVAEPPGWVFVGKDDTVVMLGSCPDDLHPSKLGGHGYFAYLRVDDADAYLAQLEAKGVRPLAPPEDKPWGMREFPLETPDGHRIMIGHVIGGTR